MEHTEGKLVINDKNWFSQRCTDASEEEALIIVKQMYKILDAHKNGVGLAANQIGYRKRIAIIKTDSDESIVLVNPEVISKSKETVKSTEGCLSFPNIQLSVRRQETITLKRQPGFSEETFVGFEAIVIQHELDHLDGKTMWNRLYKLNSNFTPKKKKRKRRK